MIEVYKDIKDLLTFNNEDDYYFLQILTRKKDGHENNRNIKNYFIRSIEYLDDKYEEIKDICNYFNARAMLRLNRRSYKKTAFTMLRLLSDALSNEDYKSIKNLYLSAAGRTRTNGEKRWIVDIDDTSDLSWVLEIEMFIDNHIKPEGTKIIKRLPTKNGIHIITKPFDLQEFKKTYSLDVHKDNPINLYIP